jgi:hypothetical protein
MNRTHEADDDDFVSLKFLVLISPWAIGRDDKLVREL